MKYVSDNIVQFESRADKARITDPVYECNHCTGQSFVLRPPSTVECETCGELHAHILWSQVFQSKTWSAL